jgi:rhomboid protease GluP
MDTAFERWAVAVVPTPRVASEVVLVLTAIGIAATVEREADGRHVVRVAVAQRAAAEHALGAYVAENVPAPPPPTPRPLAAGAVRAALWYGVGEFLIAVAASRSAFGAAWVDRGLLEGPPFRAGQWWRPVTSLTLHADFSHLLANLGFGALFLGLAGRVYGWGVALLLTLLAAVLAGAIEAAGLPVGHASLGASTAVFAALGLLAVVRWPPRGRLTPWMARAATFGGAVSLLGLLGAGDPRVDVTAHVLGFLAGLVVAWPLRERGIAEPATQWRCAIAAALVVAAAWCAALVS